MYNKDYFLQFRTAEEKFQDEDREANLCPCGHDLADEHRVISQRRSPSAGVYDPPMEVLICDVCDVACEIGEREAYEAKVEAINKAALPKVEAEVKAWLEQAPHTHIEPKK